MNFKQTYRSGSMNVVMDSEKKVLSNRSENPQSDKRPIKEFLFPFLEKNDCFALVPNRRKEGRKLLAFAWESRIAQNTIFAQKNRLYYNVIQSNTKEAQNV